MVADKVAGMVATMAADQRRCCLIGPKVFRPEPNPTCVSSELCEFIPSDVNGNSILPTAGNGFNGLTARDVETQNN